MVLLLPFIHSAPNNHIISASIILKNHSINIPSSQHKQKILQKTKKSTKMQSQTSSQQKPPTPKKQQNPCRRMHLDFQLCVKKQGFNDRECKYYLEKYESCVKKTQTL